MQTDFLLEEHLRGFPLKFVTTYDLFSYKKIDTGTKLLIDSLDVKDGGQCLDLGCGYGPIGITLAKLNPNGRVYMVDRDIVAVEYSKKNADINNIKNAQVISSNGFDHLEGISFDVIASNLPTHIAKENLQKIIADAYSHLNTSGKFYIVTTTALRRFIQKLVMPVFGEHMDITHSNSYAVLSVKKT